MKRGRLGFYVPASSIEILKSPDEFFQSLCKGIHSAKSRISLASLYLGNGGKNQQLLNILNNKVKDTSIDFSLLLDANRSTRQNKEGISSLSDLSGDIVKNLYLFRSPYQSSVGKYFPSRANEIFGTQHMKIYVFDDNIIISGANLSHDYFTNRQDRYWLIKDSKELANYYCELLDTIKGISCKVDFTKTTIKRKKVKIQLKDPEGCPSPLKKPLDYQWYGRDLLRSFIEESEKKYMDVYFETNSKAFLVPSIQMGKFFINDDINSFRHTLSSIKHDSNVSLATAYFNMDSSLSEFISQSKCKWDILTASPYANGFLGSKGFSGYIPYMYLNQEYLFLKEINFRKKENCNLYEWKKDGCTFHGKGLWISDYDNHNPHISICGSSNFGHRSLELDLETQLTLTTADPTLQLALGEERDALYSNGEKIEYSTFKKSSIHHRKIRKPFIKYGSNIFQRFL